MSKFNIKKILKKYNFDKDGIYLTKFKNTSQIEEIRIRKLAAINLKDDILDFLSNYHSIPVMDYEVNRILKYTPKNGIIIDAGGCWGWHWRKISKLRPDVKVIIVDFVKSNLILAKKLLGNEINKNIYLVCGDATDLPFKDECCDIFWTVQTFQHIPKFYKPVKEAYRVLKKDSIFINYSLNNPFLTKLFHKITNKYYHIEGELPGSFYLSPTTKGNFYLSLASENQKRIISEIFLDNVEERYTEILYQPEFKIKNGNEYSFFGKLDSYLSSKNKMLSIIAHQRSYQVKK